jgi:hypothetical protein
MKKDERIVDKCRNVWLTHSSVHTIHDNDDRIEEGVKSGTGEFVQQG